MDTIVEMAHTANSAKAYREIAEFGMDNFIFKNRRDYIDFAKKNGITSPRDLVDINVAKPYNLDLQKIFNFGGKPVDFTRNSKSHERQYINHGPIIKTTFYEICTCN